MRHEQVRERDSFDIVHVAAIWPRGDGGIQAPVGEVDQSATPAVPDMPIAVGRAIVGVYAALVPIFFVTMGLTGEARFMIAISATYICIFLGVPRIFLAVEKDPSVRPSLARFMAEGIQTNTGHMSGAAALLQMLVVPVSVACGVLAIGLAGLWIL